MKINKDKLASLTKEQKLELIKTIEQKQELEKKRKTKFVPHPGQLKILKSNKPIKIVTSANSFGKSALGVNLLHARAVGFDPWQDKHTKVPLKIVVLLDHPSKIEDVWRTEYSKWFDMADIEQSKLGKTHVCEWRYKNGTTVSFKTHDQDPLTFESIQFDMLICDEPPKRNNYIALARGQREKRVQSEQLLIGTPVSNDHAWIRTDFIQPWLEGKLDNVECFTGTSYDNKHNLADGYIEQFSNMLTDKEKRIRLHGEFSDIDSLAFGHLIADSTHLIKEAQIQWDYSWPVVIGLDPHPAKAHHAVFVGRRPYDDKLFVLKEFSAKQTAREFASSLVNLMSGHKIVDIVCDSLGQTDGSGHEGFKSFIQVLNECGVRARATTYADKDHEDTVNRIREMLALEEAGPPTFEKSTRLRFIEEKSIRTYKELQNVAWIYDKRKDLNKPRLDNAKLDYFSALCYALSSSWLAPTHYNNQSKIKKLAEPIRFGTFSSVNNKNHGIINGNNKGTRYNMKRHYTYMKNIDDED